MYSLKFGQNLATVFPEYKYPNQIYLLKTKLVLEDSESNAKIMIMLEF
jgi:hypothetical protein